VSATAAAVAAEGQLVAEQLVAAAVTRPLVAVAAVMVAAADDGDMDDDGMVQCKDCLHMPRSFHIPSAGQRTLLTANQPFRPDTLTRTLFQVLSLEDPHSEDTHSEDTHSEDTQSEDTQSEETHLEETLWAGNSKLPGNIPLVVAKLRLRLGAAWASSTVSW
jgi:hypothetical protein